MSATNSSLKAEILRKKSQFEEERLSLLERVAQLDNSITEAQAEYGALHNEELPIMKTPDEIFGIIFEYACADVVIIDEESTEHLRPPEVIISHVCHRWRAVALSVSKLWTRFSHDASINPRVPLDRLNAYMARSRNAGLDLWLGLRSPSAEHFKLLDRALLEQSRWRRFVISFERCSAGAHILNLTEPFLAPNLEYFAYRQSSRNEPFFGMVGHDGVLRAPKPKAILDAQKLQSLVLNCNGLIANLPSASRLKTLRIETDSLRLGERIDWKRLLQVLSYPSLENVSLMGDIVDPTTMTDDKLQMNALKQLRIGGHDSFLLLLFSLDAPLLEALSLRDITMIQDPDGQSASSLNDVGPYSFPSLRSLLLAEIEIPLHCSISLLKMTRLTAFAEDIWICGHDFEGSLLDGFLRSNFVRGVSWKKVKDLTLSPRVADHYEALTFLVDFAAALPVKGLAVHVIEGTLNGWEDVSDFEEEEPQPLFRLYRHASVEVMGSVVHPLWTANSWPPRDHEAIDRISDSYDPFDVTAFFTETDPDTDD